MNNTPKTNGKNVYKYVLVHSTHDSDIPDESYN